MQRRQAADCASEMELHSQSPMSHGLWKSLIYSRINIVIRPIATFLLNYNLMLDRSEFIDEADRLCFGPLSGFFLVFFFFLSFIRSRLVVIDFIATG